MRTLLVFLVLPACLKKPVEVAEKATPDACFESRVVALSADSMQGRGVGTQGLQDSANLIASWLQTDGLSAPAEGYQQSFEVKTGMELGASNALGAGEEALIVQEDFTPLGFSSSATFEGPLVFAGYGIRASDYNYDDYAGLDMSGKVMLVLRYEPGEDDPDSVFEGKRSTRHSNRRNKAMLARQAGAKALIFVTGPGGRSESDPQSDLLPPLKVRGMAADAGLPVLHVSQRVAQSWLTKAGLDLSGLQKQIDSTTQPASQELDLIIKGTVDLKPITQQVNNVIGVLPGQGAEIK